ncbi:MAG: hypothetical protein RLZZ127_1132 [Planctomycetota bacterium]
MSAAPPIDTTLAIATSEHSAFRFRVAGPVARLLAWAIDIGATVVAVGAAAAVLLILGHAGVGVLLILWFVLYWLAGAVCEWRWGATPGKFALGLRVVADDGVPAGFGACLLRNLLRYADAMPTAATGLVAMLANGRFQRLGDLAAGTLVVYADERWAPRAGGPAPDAATRTLAASLPAELSGIVDGAGVRAIAAWAARRAAFHPARRSEMAAPLARALATRLGMAPPTDADRFLHAVHLRLTGGGDGADPATRAGVHLARRRHAWARFETWCAAGVPPRDAPASPDPAPARFAAELRAVSADLALAEAYQLPEPVVDRLHRLVARGNLRFHRGAGGALARIRRAVLVEAPARLYGDPCLRIAAACFFVPFIGCALWGLADPAAAEAWIGTDLADSFREMYADAPRDRTADQAAAATGFYINNNVGISLACFASGVFAGVGSLVWLLANGVFLGVVFGFMLGAGAPVSAHFAEFVTAHGPFELCGIACSGAAGLRLGLGLVATGGLTVGASLRRSAAQAVPVLAVAAAAVALAAPIEAFVSPSALPVEAKRSVAVLSMAVIVLYLGMLGRRAQATLRAEGAA